DSAALGCPAAVTENGVNLERVHIVPRGGRPVTVWIDPNLHAAVRTQEQAPTEVVTEDFSDFRNAEGLLLPFKITSTDGRPEDTVVRTIRTYRLTSSINAADFQRPPDPVNQQMIDGAVFTQVEA